MIKVNINKESPSRYDPDIIQLCIMVFSFVVLAIVGYEMAKSSTEWISGLGKVLCLIFSLLSFISVPGTIHTIINGIDRNL